ncbi:MAG: hypothetical protein ACOH2J_15675 [Allorhizobium sp.]
MKTRPEICASLAAAPLRANLQRLQRPCPAESRFSRITHFGEHAQGGHFAALEAPAALVADIRDTFPALR